MGLSDKEHELAALHRHFTDSSTARRSIVEDIREALHALPEPGSTLLDELSARLTRVESAERDAADANDRRASELARKVDRIEGRLAGVAEEVARAKTLWPVALRSLEARLDDAVHAHRDELAAGDTGPVPAASDAPPDDLLAGLRDSLQAMSVAAEMARASEIPATRPTMLTRRRPAPQRRAPIPRPSAAPRRAPPYRLRSLSRALRPVDPLLFLLSPFSGPGRAAGWSIAHWPCSR